MTNPHPSPGGISRVGGGGGGGGGLCIDRCIKYSYLLFLMYDGTFSLLAMYIGVDQDNILKSLLGRHCAIDCDRQIISGLFFAQADLH